MKKYFLITPILILLFGCSDIVEQRMDKVVGNYIKEAQLKDEAYISVDKIDFDSLYVFRIYAMLTFDEGNLPYRIEEVNNHYVFKYKKGQEAVDLKDVPEEIKFIEKYRPGVLFYNPPFWLTIICKDGSNYKIINDSNSAYPMPSNKEEYVLLQEKLWWELPIDSLEKISDLSNLDYLNNFKCQS